MKIPPRLEHLHLERDTQTLLGDASALFSTDPERRYRYALARRWQPERSLAVFVMLNPSTATAFTTDNTLRRCQSFARNWGSGGLLLLNCFALRATSPTELRRHPDPVGADNDLVITTHLVSLAPADQVEQPADAPLAWL